METVMSRIGRLLGMRLHSSNRTVRTVPQSQEAVQSSPNTTKVVATSKSRKKKVLLKETYMKLSDSINKVKELRDKGLTYQAIGNELKISKQRVCQIIVAGKKRNLDQSKWTHGLSSRNAKLMEKLDIKSTNEAIIEINSGKIIPHRFPNFGRKSYVDLCKWLGVDPKPDKAGHCPHCGK
jgi:hypothetical protein